MKKPALLHLSRLGYEVFLPGSVERDRETNILPGPLREALERVNGTPFPEKGAEELLQELREALDCPDLGERFYRMLRDGWWGIRLIDFDHPERNRYQAAAEMVCAGVSGSFRPDITLFVNGLPLALVELKAPEQEPGIRAEYDRMRERFGNAGFRRFLQCAQILAFSDGREDQSGRLLPTAGQFYATVSRGDFPMYAFREAHPGIGKRLRPGDPALRARIRRGQGRTSPGTPTHRMLTGLFHPERFLFLLRFGIRYEQEENGEIRKRLASCEQLFTLLNLRGKILRGNLSCSLGGLGIGAERRLTGFLAPMLRAFYPEARMILADFEGRAEPGDGMLLPPAELSAEEWIRRIRKEQGTERSIYLLPVPEAGYGAFRGLRSRLRRADPRGLVISWIRKETPEGGNYTYLLACADGTLYCGWTNDLEERVRTHNAGRGARYTRSRRPVRLVYYEEFATREEAMSREWHLKRMSRAGKERLIREGAGGPASGKTREEET